MSVNSIFIGICGGSASGKSTFANNLIAMNNQDSQIISQDNYYHDRSHMSVNERSQLNFDAPESVDIERLYLDLLKLKKCEEVLTPQYSFESHSRLKEFKTVKLRKINIVEGLFVFETKELRDLFDYKIYIKADDDVRLIRRIKRDMAERGRDIDAILTQYLTSVKPMHQLHVESKIIYADYIVDSTNKDNVIQILKSFIT